jgi:hypothetical protein
MSWAAEELKTASLGDKRRNRRLIKIVEDLSAMPHASVTQAARDEAAVQGIYEFWGNVRVKANEILAAHRDSTLERVEGEEIVLAVQDTTELDFSMRVTIAKRCWLQQIIFCCASEATVKFCNLHKLLVF